MAESFLLVGLGGSYNVPVFPDSIKNCEYILIYKMEIIGGRTILRLFGFNGGVINVYEDGSNLKGNISEDNSFLSFKVEIGDTSWTEYGEVQDFSLGYSPTLFYLSDNLQQYKDTIITNNFTLELSQTELLSYTLLPIVEEQNITPIDVFGEIFGILPVLMVVLISFIGIRKGISWLFSLLRHS